MYHDGLQQYETVMYNLDVFISIGNRVKSQRGVKFRQCAKRVLKDYLIKGYAANERIRKNQIGELRQMVQIIQVFEEQNPRFLFYIVKIAATSLIGAKDIVNVLKGLFKCHFNHAYEFAKIWKMEKI